ncbi:type IV pili methyl-accepting chemotaxis transducer N-terminal domain-containing protein [Yoonia sp. BS5-3]|uniref:Type IV pili methyl-accepting chemotaxis transducer N-terminal domain-containing protein n=1 Tax=Yoonia phaeophyticola TaxID=3137369 RepID=A0ABZ2V406_9RHOB
MKFLCFGAAALSASLTLCNAQVLADEQDALEVLSALHNADVLSRGIESDGADRIRYAQRLTMLTQKVAAASCALTSDVAIDESYADLEEAMHETDIILDALKFGNEALHILGPEENRRTLHDLQELRTEWYETHTAVEAVLADGHNVDSAHVIDDHNLSLLDKATVVASDILGQYSHPYEMTQADALLINIAGRQQMLTQKMSKDACEIWTGYHADIGREDLEATMVIFENSLHALRYGMPEAGVVAAPTPEIEADLDSILERWGVIRTNLDLLLAGEELDMAQKYEIFHDFNEELKEIDHLVNDYRAYVERHH